MIKVFSVALRLGRAGCPPRLSDLEQVLGSAENYQRFMALVLQFTPQAMAEVRAEGRPEDRVARFIEAFSDRWFPLDQDFMDVAWEDEGADPYEEILRGIPLQFMGLSEMTWHELPTYEGEGMQLLCALCPCIYDGSGDEGARVALRESVADIVDAELVRRVPPEGFTLDRIRRAAQAPALRGLADLAQILAQEGGNDWLTISQDDFYEVYGGQCSWDQETVEALARDYPAAVEAWDRIQALVKWLEADLEPRFRQVVEALEGQPHFPPREQIPLIEVFAEEEG